jgi:5'/3'-nucleotidase SurE
MQLPSACPEAASRNHFEGVEAWQCSGTPVDCVKLAVDKVLHRKPDICLSGINHGANHSINVIWSGDEVGHRGHRSIRGISS